MNEQKTIHNPLEVSRRIAVYLAQLEIWPVAISAVASMAIPRLLPAAVCTAAVFWFIRWAAYKRLSLRTPGDWPILLLTLTIPVTLWTTAFPETTLIEVYRLLTGIALYYAIVNWCNSSPRLWLLISGFTLSGVLLALSAAFTVQWPIGKLPFIPNWLYQRFTLLVSDTVHPNVMAGNLVIIFPILLAWLLFGWRELRWLKRLLLGAAVFILLAVLGLTESRGAWIALGAVLMLIPILRWRWGWVGLILAGGLLAGITVWLGLAPTLNSLLSISSIGGIDQRLEIWGRSIYMIRDFPFTGIGMGSFAEVFDRLYPLSLNTPGGIPHAHNLFLQIAADLGIPGLIAWLSTLWVVCAASWQLYRSGRARNTPAIAGMGAGLLCSQLALIVHGLTDSVTWGMVRPAPIVWVIWGLAIAAYQLEIKQDR